MKSISIATLIIFMISLILVLILNLTSKKTFMDREKSSPFECGFDPKSVARLPFSLHFFLIAIIFMIFDVEITLLLPMIPSLQSSNIMEYSLIVSLFMLILLLGLYHEWNQGALNWTS
uniref:NADH-ubiquinone oxidoreductase chain 3 n=1 Tax=Caryopemon giganteus TaxID=2758555 RepID=A0A7D6ZDC1_9CUCU|nr:NADH dehydrogenase subunit 3 [Caryopemon giganteus]QLX47628.1 NADH dehydrogenase subunit 3 [Caryopemon giganteus]